MQCNDCILVKLAALGALTVLVLASRQAIFNSYGIDHDKYGGLTCKSGEGSCDEVHAEGCPGLVRHWQVLKVYSCSAYALCCADTQGISQHSK